MRRGRKLDPLREYIMAEYRVPYSTAHRYTDAFIQQVLSCLTDEARRLLLGVSR